MNSPAIPLEPSIMASASESRAATGTHVYGPPVVVEVQVMVRALAFREADGGYSVVVPELPGCVTQGETIEEVREMAVEAAALWLESQHDLRRDRAVRDLTEPLPGEVGP